MKGFESLYRGSMGIMEKKLEIITIVVFFFKVLVFKAFAVYLGFGVYGPELLF